MTSKKRVHKKDTDFQEKKERGSSAQECGLGDSEDISIGERRGERKRAQNGYKAIDELGSKEKTSTVMEGENRDRTCLSQR